MSNRRNQKSVEYESEVDQLLEEWEEQLRSNPQRSLEQFIKALLNKRGQEVIEEFRLQAMALAAIDQQMGRVAGPSPAVDQVSEASSDDWKLASLRPGLEAIPGYTLVSKLGVGGFGEVWKASGPGGFHVALKFVPLGGRAGRIEERSLDVIKDVRHPNLLSVFGTWRIGDVLVIATELADRTLLDRFQEAQEQGHIGIPKFELFGYLAEAAKGIDALNDPGKSGRQRIQHRDIKPQNLLLSGGSVKVGDYGLARTLKHDVTGHTGSLTLAYAAPEFLDGTTSHFSDQYSLAITYCHLRGGRLPFEGSPVEVIQGHLKQPPDLSMIPANERPAVGKALAKKPDDRWNSCREFVRGLSQAAAQVKKSPPPPTQKERTNQTGTKVRTAPAPEPSGLRWHLAGIVAILCVAGGVTALFQFPWLWKMPTKDAGVAQAPVEPPTKVPPPGQPDSLLIETPAVAPVEQPLTVPPSAPPESPPKEASVMVPVEPPLHVPLPVQADSPLSETPAVIPVETVGTDAWDLSKPHGTSKWFSLKEGGLRGSGRGWLATKRDYSDFELSFEYQLPKGGNSGVFLRASPHGDSKGTEFVEIQLLDDNDPQYKAFGPSFRTAALWKTVAPQKILNTTPNQWHSLLVRAVGPRIQVEHDGTEAVNVSLDHVTLPDPVRRQPSGRIGLQSMDTSGVQVRNIKIKDLAN